jgi:hypothetical protein
MAKLLQNPVMTSAGLSLSAPDHGEQPQDKRPACELPAHAGGAAYGADGHGNQVSGAFLKKSAQKTFALLEPGARNAIGPVKKVFCFFFSKKKLFLPA